MSLKTVKKIRDAVDARPAQLAEARASGRIVLGWLGYNVPEELIHALGLIPLHLGTGGDGELVTAGSAYVSSKNCVFTRQVVGEFAKGLGFTKYIDHLAVDSTCFQMYRVGEVVSYYFGIHTVYLGVPRNFALEEAREYFRYELRDFTGELEEIAGRKLDPAALEKSVGLFDSIRRSIRELYRIQALDGAPVSWREVYDTVQAGYVLDREEFDQLLKELIAEANAAGIPDGFDRTNPARLLVSGSGLPPKDRKLLDLLEELGGRVVGDDLWTGYAHVADLDIREATIEGIADAYLDRLPHASLPYLDQASDRRLANLNKLIRENGAHGVIYHTLRYCDPFSFKAGETKEVVGEDHVPLLEIHTEYAGSDTEAMRTRAEAFIEMLN